MRYLLCLMMLGCAVDQSNVAPTDVCETTTRDFVVPVQYPWDEVDETITTTTDQGCMLLTTTHYVYEATADTGTSGVANGSLPFGFYQKQCQWDAPCNLRLTLVRMNEMPQEN